MINERKVSAVFSGHGSYDGFGQKTTNVIGSKLVYFLWFYFYLQKWPLQIVALRAGQYNNKQLYFVKLRLSYCDSVFLFLFQSLSPPTLFLLISHCHALSENCDITFYYLLKLPSSMWNVFQWMGLTGAQSIQIQCVLWNYKYTIKVKVLDFITWVKVQILLVKYY